MSKKFLIKLGAPVLALSLVAACGTDDDTDPVEDEAPLNQEDDNNNDNPAENNDNNGDGIDEDLDMNEDNEDNGMDNNNENDNNDDMNGGAGNQ